MTASRSILIIEDESLIAMMLEDFLDSLGHSIAGTAETVPDAVARIDAGGFDLAILDVHLRGGEACWPAADALADQGIPFLLATGGHTEPPPARHAGAPVLAKPFTLSDVERAVDAIG
ncbi:response regulator [Sphingomonas morindae]|uniref:Response regulator n=1 Tax=Sphingomonas morindae TaxID=1541170 RepID=A0ABY4X810_9SPHN|nr:response regulator [Sphingomonas morindae]USI73009.1 response regulator [Sphingomonas morindae]